MAIATAAALAVAPAAAQATLVFVRNPLKPVVWAAADDGTAQHRLTLGSNPRVSPDGEKVAYLRLGAGRSYRPDLMLAPASGGAPPHRLLAGWREPYAFAWSPDSSTIAAVRGPELGRKHLVLIDVASGAQRVIATGYFGGVSFAPDGSELVYARGGSEGFPPRSDLYRVGMLGLPLPPAAAALPLLTHRITRDHRSSNPLWGPRGEIVFVKALGAKQRRYGPKNELYLMAPDGGRVRRLTHTKVGPLLQGLTPTEWSADGTRLLAEFGGQDTTYAVTVNPRTGAQRPVVEATEQGLVGTALSADGSTILGASGGWEPGPGHNVVSVPYAGRHPTTLARNAFEPDWSR